MTVISTLLQLVCMSKGTFLAVLNAPHKKLAQTLHFIGTSGGKKFPTMCIKL